MSKIEPSRSDSGSTKSLPTTSRVRHWRGWLMAFFVLNAVGLAMLIREVRMLQKPAGRLVVVAARPADDAPAAPDEVTAIVVEFGAPLDTTDLKDGSIILTPMVRGRTVLTSARTLRYVLAEPLRGATRYRITFAPEVRGKHGERAPRSLHEFTTPPLAVEDVSQSEVAQHGAARLAITFNHRVSPAALRSALRLTTAAGDAVSFNSIGAVPAKRLEIRLPNLTHDHFTLTIAKGLVGLSGPLGLSEAYSTTVETVAVNSATPPEQNTVILRSRLHFYGMSVDGNHKRINVRTNHSVDLLTAKKFITIDPPLEFTVSRYQWRGGFRIVAPFQAATRYQVTLRAGLSAGAAGVLKKNITRTVWIPDRTASARFAFGGGYLTPQGLLTVPIRTVNVDRVELRARKLYPANLVEYVLTGDRQLTAARALPSDFQTLPVKNNKNQTVETLLDLRTLSTASSTAPLGVYSLSLRQLKQHWRTDTAIVVVSDLGLNLRLSAGRAQAWVTSLHTAKPQAGVMVTVYSDRRQPLGQARTDADGLATITLTPTDKKESPMLAVAVLGDDMSYVHLQKHLRSRRTNSFGQRPYLVSGVEVFAVTERGVYRPGDVVKFSGLVRGVNWQVPPKFPLEINLMQPDGRVLLTQQVMSGVAGRILHSLTIPRTGLTGRYTIRVHVPGAADAAGETSFRVADYIPETLRMTLRAPASPLFSRDPLTVTATVKHLFGDAAAGLPITGRVRYYGAAFMPDGWAGYSFGDQRHLASEKNVTLPTLKIGTNGTAAFTLRIPTLTTPALIRAKIEIEAREAGGRAITETLTRDFHRAKTYLGIKQKSASLKANADSVFDLASVAPEGTVFLGAKTWRAKLYHLQWSNVLRRTSDGRLQYEWKSDKILTATRTGSFTEGRSTLTLRPPLAGEYHLVVEGDTGVALTHTLYVSGSGGQWNQKSPEVLTLTADRQPYHPGDTATITLRAPFGGTALVCVEADRVRERRVMTVPASGEITFPLAIQKSWRPNVYVTATLVRPVVAEDAWRPHRAAGLMRLALNNDDRQLAVAITPDTPARPGAPMTVNVRVTKGDAPLANSAVVLAAVDEGVLALTHYTLPSPEKFFYGERRLGVREMDMYSRLAPELSAWKLRGKALPGGGGDKENIGQALARRLNPIAAKRVETAVLYAGALVTDDKGVARVTFTIPEYLGELRLMAYAASGENFGQAKAALPVRSPVMYRASWPRFLAPGDRVEVPVTIFNRRDTAGAVQLSLTLDGPAKVGSSLVMPTVVDIPAGGEKTLLIPLHATGVGKLSVRLTASLGDAQFAQSVELAIRPPVAFARASGMVVVPSGEAKSITLAGAFYPGTAKTQFMIGGSPTIELGSALEALLQYPYGCVEQTTSRIVPLIYLRDLAELSAAKTVGQDELDRLINAGILRLHMMQTASGALAWWPGGKTPYDWGTIYAGSILLEAKKARYDVPARLLDPLLDYVNRQLERWCKASDTKKKHTQLGEAAYAVYLLARAGRTPYEWLARLEELSAQMQPTARFHLAAALFVAGEAKAAKGLIGNAAFNNPQPRQINGYLHSPVREMAIMLSTLLDIKPASAQVPALAMQLKQHAKSGRWGTTQENAFALMALGKFARHENRNHPAPNAALTVTLPDGVSKTLPLRHGFSRKNIPAGKTIRVQVSGGGKAYVFWQTEGAPRENSVTEEDSGMTVRRTFSRLDGKNVSPDAFVQGELYRVTLRVSTSRQVDNLVLTDLLPAGLEIENATLGGANISFATNNVALLLKPLIPVHVERRDDRLLVFAQPVRGLVAYTYIVRAVSAGQFTLPAVEASCMYDPGVFSVHGRGTITVTRHVIAAPKPTAITLAP